MPLFDLVTALKGSGVKVAMGEDPYAEMQPEPSTLDKYKLPLIAGAAALGGYGLHQHLKGPAVADAVGAVENTAARNAGAQEARMQLGLTAEDVAAEQGRPRGLLNTKMPLI